MPRILLAAVVALAALGTRAEEAPAARRVISLNPSLTAILVAIGARETLVGVDDYSARAVPEVAALPRVGGLYNPSLEAVLALRPDLLALVPSVEQRDFRARLTELGVAQLVLDPIRFDEVLRSIETLGARVGREGAAKARADAIRDTWGRARTLLTSEPRPRAVLVLQRDPLFVAGAGNFVDEMLAAAGLENAGAAIGAGWPRSSREWLIAASPAWILDASGEVQPASEFWARWPSLAAVRERHVVSLPPGLATLPGPYLDRGLVTLVRSVYGEGLAARVAGTTP